MPTSSSASAPKLIEPGKAAPAFTLKDQHDEEHSLRGYKGKSVVLYFYPKDDTPGCTTEACSFRDHASQLGDLRAVVLGVSPDDSASHERFAAKHKLPFPLLVDTDARVCAKYGVWGEKNLYGRKFIGVVRTTYLIGPDGKVARRWDKVKVNGHVEAVLAEVARVNASLE